MNVTEQAMREYGLDRNLAESGERVGAPFSSTPEVIYAFTTYGVQGPRQAPGGPLGWSGQGRLASHAVPGRSAKRVRRGREHGREDCSDRVLLVDDACP